MADLTEDDAVAIPYLPQDAVANIFRQLMARNRTISSIYSGIPVRVVSCALQLLAPCERVCKEWYDVIRGELLHEDWVKLCASDFRLSVNPCREQYVRYHLLFLQQRPEEDALPSLNVYASARAMPSTKPKPSSARAATTPPSAKPVSTCSLFFLLCTRIAHGCSRG